MTILIDMKLVIAKNAENLCGNRKFNVVVDTYSKTFVSMDHFACDASVFW